MSDSDGGWGEVIANVAEVALQIAATVAINKLTASLTATDKDGPEANRTNLRQRRPVRRFAVGGPMRASGAFAMRRAIDAVYSQVYLWPEGPGPIIDFLQNWMNEDEVNTTAENWIDEIAEQRYETGRAKLQERYGTLTQSAYDHLADFGWSAEHWGAGVPSTALVMEHGKAADALKQFPSAANTELTRAPRYAAYDWRQDSTAGGDGPQRRPAADATPEEIDEAKATWTTTRNVAVNFVNALWQFYGEDWDTTFAPTLDILTAAADLCDEMVPQRVGGSQVTGTANEGSDGITLDSVEGLQVGSEIHVAGMSMEATAIVGTVASVTPDLPQDAPFKAPVRWINAVEVLRPRYEISMWWSADETKKQVCEWFREAMDGYYAFTETGALVMYPGVYAAPTVIFGERELSGVRFDPGPDPGDEPNVYELAYDDPLDGYGKADAGSWSDETQVLADGQEVPTDFTRKGVLNNNQLNRLAKAEYDRRHAPRVTFRTPLSGLRGQAQPFVGLRTREHPELFDAVVEVDRKTPPHVEFSKNRISWAGTLVTPVRWDFNAATEETDGPVAGYSASPQVLTPPTITSLTAFYAAVSTGGDGVKVRIEGDGPGRADLTGAYRFREVGDALWTERLGGDIDAAIVMETGEFLPTGELLEFQISYLTGGGARSVWSPEVPEQVSTSTDAIAPGAPTFYAIGSAAPGEVQLSGRNATSLNFDHVRVWRGAITDLFAAAVSQGTLAGAAGADFAFEQTGVTAGSYRFWVTAENAADTASAPIGPFAVTVA